MATFNENVTIRGTLVADKVIMPDEAIGDQQINPGDPIDAAKLEHQNSVLYTQPHGAVSVDARTTIYRALAPGSILRISAGHVVAMTGDSTVTVDLLKNGATVLSALITLDNSHAAYDIEEGGLIATPSNYAADDIFEVVINATVGTGVLGQGLFVNLVVREDAE